MESVIACSYSLSWEEAVQVIRLCMLRLLERQERPMLVERQSAATEADTPDLVLSGQLE
jgi:hypothetical protein